MTYQDDYSTIDVRPYGSTSWVDPTQPGQLAVIQPGSQSEAELVHTVHQHLPARKQNRDTLQVLFECLAQAPHDFAGIAQRHNVGPVEITINNQNYELAHYDYQQYDQRQYETIQHYQPHFAPVYSPTIDFNPIINVDANALARARSESHQDNSGYGDNRFWQLVFIVILGLAVITLIGKD